MGIAFYDVTTLYFESSVCDDLRVPGWSKDGRSSNPQVVLGLLNKRNIKALEAEGYEYILGARLKAAGSGITLKRAMFLSERIYQLGYTNPFSRKEETFILRSRHDDEVNELIRIVAAACDPPPQKKFWVMHRRKQDKSEDLTQAQ